MNTKLPSSFNPYQPPRFYGGSEPTKTKIIKEKINEIQLFDGEEIPELGKIDGAVWVFDRRINKYDNPDDYYLVALKVTEVPNPQYDDEIYHYNEARAVFNTRLEEWNNNKKIWDEEQARIKEEKELEEFKRLKAKFEKKS